MAGPNWLDRVVGGVAPGWALKRERDRARLNGLRARAEYDGATYGRRSLGWKRRTRDANQELRGPVTVALRGIAHEMVRNNPFAARAATAIANNLVGAGITFQVYRNGKVDADLTLLARRHFDSTACDAEGRHNLYGLQTLAARSMAVSGAGLARRRWRRAADGLPVPFQIQLLEPDYIDMSRHGVLRGGAFQVFGIEFSPIGKRSAYWLYSAHPGSSNPGAIESKAIPAEDIAHFFRADRPEQQHGATWFAPVILRMKDFGDYEDAQLVRQKIAACFTAFRIGGAGDDGTVPPADSNGDPIDPSPYLENLEPGIIEDLPDGGDIKFAEPPGVDGYEPYSRISLQAISAGVGIPYEVLTGDLSKVSFISGRLGRLQFKTDLEFWQWSVFIPQFCEPAGQWFLEAAAMAGVDVEGASFKWTPPRFAEMSPETAIPATRDAIRSGQQTISGACRERGEDPDVFLAEWAEDAKRLDELGLIFDSDPRRVTQVGNAVGMTVQQMDKRGQNG